MPGGIMQLITNGSEDIYLTGNPQITFFKSVYRRHTNFSMETKVIQFTGNINFGRTISSKITKQGDLVNDMYLQITINSIDPLGANFAWIKKLGHAIISNISVELNGTIIDQHNGTWLDIWYELTRNSDHDYGYNQLIGNIPELTSYNTDVKPVVNLFIPLQFWFNKYVGLAVPLIALQYSTMNINITLNQLENIIIRDDNFNLESVELLDVSLLCNYIYLDGTERQRFATVGHEYLIDQLQFNEVENMISTIHSYNIDFNHSTKELIWAIKNGNFISSKRFIFYSDVDDWEEKDDTDLSALDYASRKIILESVSISSLPIDGTWIEIQSGNDITPTIETIESINVYNYFNDNVYINPYSLSIGDYQLTQKIQCDVTITSEGEIFVENIVTGITVRDLSFPHEVMTDTRISPNDPYINQFDNYGLFIDKTNGPLNSAIVRFNGSDRFDIREGAYFNYVQPYQHHSNTPKDGIYCYSFSLYPEEYQPSGTANLLNIDNKQIELRLFDPSLDASLPTIQLLNQDNKIYLYGPNLNVLRFYSGYAGVAYNFNQRQAGES